MCWCETSQHFCRVRALWRGQFATFATFLLARSGNGCTKFPVEARTSVSCSKYVRCYIHGMCPPASNQQEKHSFLHKTLFMHHTPWSENRHLLKSTRLKNKGTRKPELQYHHTSTKDRWLYNSGKHVWAGAQLATESRMDHRASASSSSSDHAHQRSDAQFAEHPTPDFVKKLCEQGQIKEAVQVLEVLVGMSTGIGTRLIYSLLKECMTKKDLMLGMQVHALAVKMGCGSDAFLCNHFIRMYAAHGKLQEAIDVFNGVPKPNVFMWAAIILAHAKQGQAQRAVELYQHMRTTRMKPNGYVLTAALQACAAARDLQSGKQVHKDVLASNMTQDTFVCTCLVDMYVKCGSLKDARIVFDGLPEKDVVTWNAMIAGYAKVEGMGHEALRLYSVMCNDGKVAPGAVTFASLLQACADVGVSALENGKQFHSQLKDRLLERHLVVCNSLINMYTKCGSLKDARVVFDGLCEKDVVTWSAMIAGYARVEGMGHEALGLYSVMCNEGKVAPAAETFVSLLQACANVGASALENGKQFHSQLKERRLESNVVVSTSLINMYTKCGSLEDARLVFDTLSEKNVVTWNAMIAGYAKVEGMGHEALSLYSVMCNEGRVAPDAVTFSSLFQACANLGASALENGKQFDSELKERRVECDVVVWNSLINMYAKCGSLKDARLVFDGISEKNVVTWNAMIAGYAEVEGMGHEALSLYTVMCNEGKVAPDAVTFASLLQACANVGPSVLAKGKQFHSQLRERRLECNVVVSSSLINMYTKCGSLEDARLVFDRLSEKNAVTWNAMIVGYAKVEGMEHQALSLYNAMRNEAKVAPDAVTFASLLQACANVGASALENGKQFHSQLRERRLERNVVVSSSLIDMYAKCGSLKDARIVFDGLGEKNVVTWTAMIAGYARVQGLGQEALGLYTAMRSESMIAPNAVTFLCLLQACANVGVSALAEGKHFHSQLKEQNLESSLVVCNSLIDMYAKCGSLKDARIVFDGLGEKDVVTWTAMIAGYARVEGFGQEALGLYSAMRSEGKVAPDADTFVTLLWACASLGAAALETGKQLHSELKDLGLASNMRVGYSLVYMYAKCGSLKDSGIVLDGDDEKSAGTWDYLIPGSAREKCWTREAMYSAMLNKGIGALDALAHEKVLKDAECSTVSQLRIKHLEYVPSESSISIYQL